MWTFTTLAQKVKANSVLYLQSRDVTICPGMDNIPSGSSSVQSKKRALSVTENGPFCGGKKKEIEEAPDEEEYDCKFYKTH